MPSLTAVQYILYICFASFQTLPVCTHNRSIIYPDHQSILSLLANWTFCCDVLGSRHYTKGGCENFRFRGFAKISRNYHFRVSRNFPSVWRNFRETRNWNLCKIFAKFHGNFAKRKREIALSSFFKNSLPKSIEKI